MGMSIQLVFRESPTKWECLKHIRNPWSECGVRASTSWDGPTSDRFLDSNSGERAQLNGNVSTPTLGESPTEWECPKCWANQGEPNWMGLPGLSIRVERQEPWHRPSSQGKLMAVVDQVTFQEELSLPTGEIQNPETSLLWRCDFFVGQFFSWKNDNKEMKLIFILYCNFGKWNQSPSHFQPRL